MARGSNTLSLYLALHKYGIFYIIYTHLSFEIPKYHWKVRKGYKVHLFITLYVDYNIVVMSKFTINVIQYHTDIHVVGMRLTLKHIKGHSMDVQIYWEVNELRPHKFIERIDPSYGQPSQVQKLFSVPKYFYKHRNRSNGPVFRWI